LLEKASFPDSDAAGGEFEVFGLRFSEKKTNDAFQPRLHKTEN
jgi:hypothetical protein